MHGARGRAAGLERARTVRGLILYEHFCPQHVAALRVACAYFGEQGDTLLPLEYARHSPGYGWTADDAPRGPGWLQLGFLPYGGRAPLGLAAVLAQVLEQEVDVVAVNGWYDPLVWALVPALRAAGRRVVLVADSFQPATRSPARDVLRRAFLRGVDAVFTAGSRHVAFYAEAGVPAERIHLGCDVVDNAHFERGPREAPAAGRRVVFGTAARLVPEKNLERGLEAFDLAARVAPVAIEWRIAGRGALAENLRARAAGLVARVDLVGFVGYQAMPDFLGGLDVYWQPSAYEPWGLAVNEAAAAGLPILVSDACGAGPDLVGAENGWVHDPTSVEAMAAALTAAVAARARYPALGSASRRRAASWGPERFAHGLHGAMRAATEGS